MRIDVHQHLLPEPLLGALERRRNAPRIRRGRSDWVLDVAGEPPSVLNLSDHDPDARAARADAGVPVGHTLRIGDGVTFAPSAIHRVSHARGEPAVSLHAYSPPLRSMGSYAVDGEGELRRLALGDDEELRPLSSTLALAGGPSEHA